MDHADPLDRHDRAGGINALPLLQNFYLSALMVIHLGRTTGIYYVKSAAAGLKIFDRIRFPAAPAFRPGEKRQENRKRAFFPPQPLSGGYFLE